MKYYEMHEEVYKDINDKGLKGWGGSKDLNELLDNSLSHHLKRDLRFFFGDSLSRKSALDLGTGTGPTALMLAKEGFQCTGYDISKTAIEIANSNALQLGLDIDFKVYDIVTSDSSSDVVYDLIADSSFLHCIVKENDRKKVLKYVHNSLSEDGYFFLHTMIKADDMSDMLSGSHIFLENETLWSTGPDRWDMEWENVNDQKVFAHRLIRTKTNLEREIQESGFKILKSSVSEFTKNPSCFIAWLQKI